MMKAIPKTHNTRYADICAPNHSHDAYSVVPLLHSAVLPDSGSTADLPCWLSQLLLTLDDEHPLRGLLSGQDATSVYQENGTIQSDYLKSSVREIQEDHAIFAYSLTRHFSDPSVHRIGFHESRRLAMKLNEMRASDGPLLTGSSDTGLSWTYDSEQAGSYDWLSSMPTSFLNFQHHSLSVAHPDEPILPITSESSDHYKYVYGEAPPFSTPGPTSVLSFQNTVNPTFLTDDNLICPEMRYVACNR
jgi:hypothetical protein